MFHSLELPAVRLLAAALSCALAPLGVLAQDAPPTPSPSPDGSLPAVAVTGRAERPNGVLPLSRTTDSGSLLGLTVRETPAAVTVVDRDTLEARGARNTQEILSGIPGITAHDAPGNVGVSYRGFGTGSIGQLFNGISVQYSIAARPVDSWIIDRVEAIGGPSSFLFGSGALGGAVNYVTKVAERGTFTDGRVRLGSHGLREVSAGLNRRVAGDGSGAVDHHVRLDLNHRRDGQWTDGSGSRATQLAASLLSDVAPGLTHLLAYEFQHERVDRPYWGTPLLNPISGTGRVDEAVRFKNYNSADGLYAQRVQWLRSVTQWRAGGALTLKNTVYAYDALRDYRNVESYRYTPDNTAVIRSATLLQRHDHQVVGNRIEGQYLGALAGRRSDWAVALDLSVNRQTRFPNSLPGVVSTVDPLHFTPERFFDIPGMRPGYRPDRDNRVETIAFSLENRTALAERLHLVSGLRHERIRLELTNRREVTAANPSRFERSYRPTTGRVGLVWDLSPEASLYAQFATAADPPSGTLSTASFADVRHNSELTTGRQAEVGSKLGFWDGKGTATLAAYRITRRHIATQDPDNSSLTVLVGEQSAQGVELAVGLQPTPRWSVQANLANVDATYERFRQGGISLKGKTPANTPATVANLWVSYAITPALQASAGVRHVGKVYADAANTVHWPRYTLLDLGLAWRIDRSATLTARVRNATDRVHAAHVTSTLAYLGAPRTVDLALRMAF